MHERWRGPHSIAGSSLVHRHRRRRQWELAITIQIECLRFAQLNFRQRPVEYRAVDDPVEDTSRYHVLALVRGRQIGAQLSGNRVLFQICKLPRIGANESLWNQSNPHETLAVFVRFSPRVGPSVVAACAYFDNSALPSAAFLRSIGPKTSSGHLGGANRCNEFSIFWRLRISALESKRPS